MSAPEQPPKLGPSWVPQNAATPPEWKQPPTPKPGMPKAAKITLGIIGGLVLIGGCNAIITGGKGTDSTPASAAKPAPAPTVTVTVTQTVAAAAAPAVTVTAAAAPAEPAKESAPAPGDSFDGSGTYLVGDDIQPGTYKTAGPGSLGLCYWERAKDSSGGFESIIANENLRGQGVVTIKSSDKVFKTTGCQAWVKAK